jgi:WD40 repeat protein
MQSQGTKRKDPPSTISNAIVISKKSKNEGEIIVVENRTSNLKSPIMLLEGHQAEVNAVKFSPDGQSLATAGVDKQICMFFMLQIELHLITISAMGCIW